MVDLTATTALRLLQNPINDIYSFAKGKTGLGIEKLKTQTNIKKLSKSIINIQNVKTIYKGDSAINLKTFYYPSRILKNGTVIDVSHIKQITERNSVVQGTAGQGKSIFMRYMTSQETQIGERIPVFFELRRLKENEGIRSALIRTISTWYFDISEDLFNIFCESGKIVLFLDGFDEIPLKRVQEIICELDEFSEKYGELQIIVSSRPESGIEASNYFDVLRLEPYGLDEQKGLITKLVEDKDSREQIFEALCVTNEDIQELLRTPLMVTLFIMTYRAKQIIPETMSEFYEQIFSVLMFRHDKTKPGFSRELETNLNEKQMQEIFEWICFLSKKEDEISFSYNRISEIAKQSLARTGHEKISPEKLINDFSKSICLLLKDGHEYSFIHKSIQEFFVSSFVKNLNEDQSIKFYTKIKLDYQRFRSELKFLKDIDTYRFFSNLEIPTIELLFETFGQDANTFCDNFIKNLYTDFKEYNTNKFKIIHLHVHTELTKPLLNDYLKQKIIDILCIVLDNIFIKEGDDVGISGFSYSMSDEKFSNSENGLRPISTYILSNKKLKKEINSHYQELSEVLIKAKSYVSLKSDIAFLDDF